MTPAALNIWSSLAAARVDQLSLAAAVPVA
jgi:hypothetical protein